MTNEARLELAPNGVLRAGINMSNILLVTGATPDGDPTGVAPDMARAIADRLGVALKLVPFPRPSEVAEAAGADKWDLCLIGAEPQRADKIAFTPAYVEIEATYLVPEGSPLRTIADVDRPGTRIAVMKGSAYGLWLDRNIHQATLLRADSSAAAVAQFRDEKLDALAGLRPGLAKDIASLPGTRMLEGRFMSVQQAIGTEKKNTAAAAFLNEFVSEAKSSGLVADLIRKHEVVGLTVAA